ncbi:uncharacterized protein L3040_000857 [Drepanopeziza brunnea f. sp. 'multigermtubi']|uniref:Pentatricopeptide repeat protein n=1 Tax=Marssonina brunnea f. sp. multigermtubi (strain MB_m1) TaxID=1072389 RepID=K1X7S4_MARBU|nr:pentatricopeptide repeat protein [Drepanopeziza brunnea f. sp. 'multigermtubi' MB_m1]EKD21106.1 pentatricopeptide repeat protein [Drepanopeziza brunnea f. sp. 'multigermtubi' MB_m1]KAJ5054587.1 hypothetical protein L3040_000857 [Drepanopeziza brunnea f. sp. 'multigermtubi']
MSSPHICLACRRRLGQLRPPRVVQWRSRATFISLSSNKPPATRDVRPPEGTSKEEVRSRPADGSHDDLVRVRKIVSQPTPGDVLETLFEQTIQPPSARVATKTLDDPQRSKDLYKAVERLKDMVASSHPVRDAWAFFLEHFGPEATEARIGEFSKQSRVPAYVVSTAYSLLNRFIQAKSKDPLSPSLPSSTEVLKVFHQIGSLRGREWHRLVSINLQALLKLRQQQAKDSENENRLFADLLGLWNLASRDLSQLTKFPAMESSAVYWSTLPPVLQRDANFITKKQPGTNKVFGLLVPIFSMGEIDSMPLPILTLASFGVFSERSTARDALPIDITPLLIIIGRVINTPELDLGRYYDMAQNANLSLVTEYVKSNWPSIKQRASEVSQLAYSPVDKTLSKRMSDLQSLDPTTRFSLRQVHIGTMHRRLFNAMQRKNLREVDDLWSDVVKWPVDTTGASTLTSGSSRGILTIHLVNYFMLIYMTLRQPNRAIDVWNFTIKSGMTPDCKTWTSMLDGCKAARDGEAVKQIWSRMLASKIVPDNHLWVSRVSALIHCRDVDSGIAAIDEMGRLWMEAARLKHPSMPRSELQLVTDVTDVVKPSIEVVNAAVHGLLELGMTGAAYKILAWAGKFGVAPDIITYNTLLRQLIKGGHTKESMALLQRMQKTGIQADEYTFTIILDETLGDMEGLSPEESIEIVQSIFEDMVSAGVMPGTPIYSKIIRQLLDGEGGGNMAAVDAVLAYMAKQNRDPGHVIFTMLMNYEFTRKPPNLDGARRIIERATATAGGTDEVFWNRAIVGYASVGETGPALRILGRMQDSMGKVGWKSMRAVLLALIDNQQMELAKKLVDNAVIDNGGPFPSTDTRGIERQAGWNFWTLAREYGLVEEERHLKEYETPKLTEETKKAQENL